MKVYICNLPEGTKIKILKVHQFDSHYYIRKKIEGKTFVAKKDPEYHSMSFIKEDTGESFVFFLKTTYKILIPIPINQ